MTDFSPESEPPAIDPVVSNAMQAAQADPIGAATVRALVQIDAKLLGIKSAVNWMLFFVFLLLLLVAVVAFGGVELKFTTEF